MWRWDDERYHFSVRLCVDTAPLAVILMSFNIITHLGLKTLWREHVRRSTELPMGSPTRLTSTLSPSLGTETGRTVQ